MSPDKLTVFNALKEQFVVEQRRKAEEEQAEEMKAKAAEAERIAKFASMSKAKQDELANMDPSWPIEKLPDCDTKWEKIVAKGKAEPDWKYTDEKWDICKDPAMVLGDRLNNKKEATGFTEFKRASEMDGFELFIDGASCRDICQGQIGDCYLLSAISVMATDQTGDAKIQ